MRPTPPPLQSHAPAPPFRLLAISPASALVLLLCFWLVGYLITSAVLYFIIYKLPDTEPALRIGSVLQDLILFILPAIATAMLSTRLPATLLGLVERPRFITVIFAFATLIISIPAMNLLIQINQSLSLPESMSAIEHWMRASEANAADSINTILGGSDVGSLIISLLIVGILAGLSEELLFRGALQRLLMACRIGHHGAIWLAAFIFSAVHMQFFGFVPRLLLGAFFGYLFYWSGSLWLPVLAHFQQYDVCHKPMERTPSRCGILRRNRRKHLVGSPYVCCRLGNIYRPFYNNTQAQLQFIPCPGQTSGLSVCYKLQSHTFTINQRQ